MKRSPYLSNRQSWDRYLTNVRRLRISGMGPFEWVISHRPFIRSMMIGVVIINKGRWGPDEILPPILTPKPPPKLVGFERLQLRRRSVIKHRDPRYCKPYIDPDF